MRQSSFLVYAPVRPGQADALRATLAKLNRAPGFADPDNTLVPFTQFGRLHVARFVVVDDPTLEDRAHYPGAAFDPPVALAFMGFCDGNPDTMLADFAVRAPGLPAIFAHCETFTAHTDVLAWMRAHRQTSATDYVNWQGRSAIQVHEETWLHGALRQALRDSLSPAAPGSPASSALALARTVRARVDRPLTPIARPTLDERVRELAHFLLLPAVLLALTPLLLLLALPFAITLRRLEKSDPVIVPRPHAARIAELSQLEDHDVTNPFTAVGSLKPGLFRRTVTRGVFFALSWAVRHLYRKGRLARVGTIHFARWVWIDGGRRLLFASNYDGGLETYMDDFINKAGFGLNLVFSNGIGYPRTDWLITGGARREQDFKAFLRRHQIPTDVWYKAASGLTTYDLARNSRIRQRFEAGFDTEREASDWLAEISA